MNIPRSRLSGIVGLLLLGASLPAAAQTNAEVNAGVQFNFTAPGARSLGLGGAFVALADDATAAYSNPAGLTALSRPEVSVEARNWSFTNTYTDRGRASGAPSGIGVDTLGGLRQGSDHEQTSGLSFLSVVYPQERWAVALYRHELAVFKGSFQAQGAFLDGLDRLLPTQNSLHLDIVNLGLSAAFHLTDDISLGAGVSLYDFKLGSRTQRYALNLPSSSPGGIAGPPLYTAENLEDTESQAADDRALGLNAGVLWRVSSAWQLGAVYRQGPEFAVDAAYSPGPALAASKSFAKKARFNTPDVFGLGADYQPTETATITMDYVRVLYSDLTRSFTNVFPDSSLDEPRQYRVDDANEAHLGFEQIFTVRPGFRLAGRLGSWYEPDHRIRYVGARSDFRALFQAGDGHLHGSAGIGLIGQRFQLDAAFDYSEQVKTASLSTVVRF